MLDPHDGALHTLGGDDRVPETLPWEGEAPGPGGRTRVTFSPQAPADTAIRMQIAPDARKSVVAALRPHFLLGLDQEMLACETTKVGLVQDGAVLFSSLPPGQDRVLEAALRKHPHQMGAFTWESGDRRYLAHATPLYLKGSFEAPLLTLVLSLPQKQAQAPLGNFATTFILLISATVLVTILLSIKQIRKGTVPLEELRRGTLRIAAGNLNTRVHLESNDEFEDLAEAFNAMVSKLERQFTTLTSMASIDREILSLLHTQRIVDTILMHADSIFECDAVAVGLLDTPQEGAWRYVLREIRDAGGREERPLILEAHERRQLIDHASHFIPSPGAPLPGYLRLLDQRGYTAFLVIPIFLQQGLQAFAVIAHRAPHEYTPDELDQARQMADRLGVALYNACLIEELNSLNWGTMTALARVVDATSPWTAGHSERVAAMAAKIARAMNLCEHEIDLITRAGLLHDIGKISVPAEILDKPGALSPEEYHLIQQHPLTAVRILEPIVAFTELLPIIGQHHERYDRGGYPYGLSGEDIVLGARILAVADTFDAMTSDRPYRSGMQKVKALALIRQEKQRQFDPDVVSAFLSIVDNPEEEFRCTDISG